MARPRKHQLNDLLDGAMDVFWSRGYDGTTTEHLEAATGVKRGSLYNAFKDKHGLYLAVLDHYGQIEMGAAARLFREAGSFTEAATVLLQSTIQSDAGSVRSGCLLCDAAIERAPRDVGVGERVRRSIDILRRAIMARLNVDHPELPLDRIERSADSLASRYMGLKVFWKAGYPAEMLRGIIQDALSADGPNPDGSAR